MNLRKAERYLEQSLQVTREIYQRHLERELSIEGLCQRLSQFADVAYVGIMISIFPVTLYSLSSKPEREAMVLHEYSHIKKTLYDSLHQ